MPSSCETLDAVDTFRAFHVNQQLEPIFKCQPGQPYSNLISQDPGSIEVCSATSLHHKCGIWSNISRIFVGPTF
jgi:hypothetical protein